jgi:hypothetical protein
MLDAWCRAEDAAADAVAECAQQPECAGGAGCAGDCAGPQLTAPLNEAQILAWVEQLYKLTAELKDEAEHTNLATMFPLSFVRKAQQIERLAKQIKDHAKGGA